MKPKPPQRPMKTNNKLLQTLGICLALAALPSCALIGTTDTTKLDTAQSFNWTDLSIDLRAFDSWTITGKIGVRTPNQTLTAAINQWIQTEDIFDIHLSSTFFGLGQSRLVGNPVFITLLEAGEDPVSSDQPDALLNKALGFPMPISALPYWLKGLPLPNARFSAQYYANGLPKSMEQSDWSLSFEDYTLDQALPLPGKIKLVQGDARITLVIKEWKNNSN